MEDSLGMLETTGLTPALVALDSMEKSADVRVLQAEVNDFLGVIIKLLGPIDAIQTALGLGLELAERMGGKPVSQCINRPDAGAWRAIESPAEFNPLIQQDVVTYPTYDSISNQNLEEQTVAQSDALGFIETQGFTAVFDAIDTACKAASVEVLGKEKLGGGYVTVVIRGDVAAVRAAVEAGRSRVDSLGNLIAAHVISKPSPSVLALLPK